MRIKICGLFRDEDIDFVNEACPDFAGFVFSKSPQQVSTALAQYLRFRIAEGIIPVGVFVNAPIAMIAELYQNGVISIAQLHGDEDDSYITSLKRQSVTSIRQTRTQPIKVIKTLFPNSASNQTSTRTWLKNIPAGADYILVDLGEGSGKTSNWDTLKSVKFTKPWFFAGGINAKNIGQAMKYNPFAVDINSGAETDGIKDRQKILQLTKMVKESKK